MAEEKEMKKRVGRMWGKGRVGHRLEEKTRKRGYLEIRDRIESDHHTVIAWMKKKERRRNGEERRRRVHRGIWEKRKLLEPD